MLGSLQDNRDRSDSLFASGQPVATLFESFTGTGSTSIAACS
jgi:hypothetical protein